MVAEIAVIGGGAAGMMAAYAAAQSGQRVTLFEKNEKLGKKLFLTGKGRCNLTNACDLESFFLAVPRNGKFLYSALYGLSNDALVALFEAYGLATKVERGGRVFPASDKSSDVIRTLDKMLRKSGVQIWLNTEVNSIRAGEGEVIGLVAGGDWLSFDRVIVTTGGRSYPKTGSTGDGYRFAQELGHQVTDIRPSLIPMVVREQEVCKRLQGLSLKNIRLSLYEGKKELFCQQGEMLFTHFGVSGPLVLSASAHIRDYGFADTRIVLDLKPALGEEKLDARLLRDFEENPKKILGNALFGLFPRAMAGEVIRASGVPEETPVCEITREQRRQIILATKRFVFRIAGLRSIDEAIITRGGVSVRDIVPGTMESRRVRGLYFAGEVLDLDAYTGGYNLQIAFSTGFLAGNAAADFQI